ncbi:MAG: SH3 domain-containing protein [Anaerolineae bacterium]|nr:SH3 domain-containing protein [Anaerolineae bacterium]
MKRLSLLFYGLLCFGIFPVMAADCPALVQQALAATTTLCHETGKNQACYGNVNLKAKPNSNVSDFHFSQPGDRVDINTIKSLQLSPMTLDTGEWGVALMNVQANLPSTAPANLTLLAFGDVTLENDVPSSTALDISVVGNNAVNARLVPSLNAGIVGTLKPNQTVTALDRLGDSSWLRVKLPDSDQMGWVKSDFITSEGDVRTLNIVDGSQPYYAPMQAFTFKSGTEASNCAEVPENGLIIQTPEGSGEVQLWINQVVVKLGSTVYFQAQPDGNMTVTTVEGHATVEAMGVTYTAVAGSSLHIPVDANMNAVAPPTLPQAYEVKDVANLPIDHLQRKIKIHPPLTPQEVDAQQQKQIANNPLVPCPAPKDGPKPKEAKCPNPDAKPPKGDKGPGPADGKPKPPEPAKPPEPPKPPKDEKPPEPPKPPKP